MWFPIGFNKCGSTIVIHVRDCSVPCETGTRNCEMMVVWSELHTHSASPSSHTHGVAIILSPRAKAAWDAAGCVFQPVSERILRLRLKCHMSYMTVVAVYAPTNPPNSTSEAISPSEAFYDQLQSTLTLDYFILWSPSHIGWLYAIVWDLTFPYGTRSLVLVALVSATRMGNDC